jgi:hypothetical protein
MTVASPLLDSAMDTELVVLSSTSRMPPSMVGRCEVKMRESLRVSTV